MGAERGTYIGDIEIPWEALQTKLYHSRTFQTYYGGRISLAGLGHIVCELRQNCGKEGLEDLAHFVKDLKNKPTEISRHKAIDAKREDAQKMAAYALGSTNEGHFDQ